MTTRFGLKSSRGLIVAIKLLSCATVIMWSASSRAGVIVNDTWNDGTRTDPAAPVYSENGTDTDADGNLESAWYNAGTGATLAASAGHLLMTIPTGSASWTTFFTPESGKVNLANVGDQLKVTWVFTTGDVNTSNTSQNFRLAVLETPNGSRISTDAAPNSAAYAGAAYAMFMNMGETTGNGNSFNLKKRSVLTASDVLGTSGNWATSLGNGLGNTAVGYADNTKYTFVETFTRNASNGLDIVSTMTGGNIGGTGSVSVSATDASPAGFLFDTFTLRPSGSGSTATTFDTSLFKVEGPISVPEPATVVMALVGCLALGVVARRR